MTPWGKVSHSDPDFEYERRHSRGKHWGDYRRGKATPHIERRSRKNSYVKQQNQETNDRPKSKNNKQGFIKH
jgi:hypothetical protein